MMCCPDVHGRPLFAMLSSGNGFKVEMPHGSITITITITITAKAWQWCKRPAKASGPKSEMAQQLIASFNHRHF